MRYRLFGQTGLKVSVVGFGCWPMAGDRYGAIEDDEAVKAIHRALDRGVNCVDTAPAYGAGHSEEVVARALEKRRSDVILVTKCGVKAPPPGQLGPLRDSSRLNILNEVDASLNRLRTDWVDVLLVHWPDAGTPFEETMRGLEEVVTSGRARFVGVSNFTGAMIAECMRTRRVDVSQVGYHMFDRRQEQETFPSCLTHAIGVMGYGSLGHGLLTGAFTASTSFGDPGRDWRGNGVAFGQHLPRRQFQDEHRRGRAASPGGRRAAWRSPEPDRARLGARASRDQHRAGRCSHPRGGRRQRRRRRARALIERTREDRCHSCGRGRARAGVHPAATSHGAVGRGNSRWTRRGLSRDRCGSGFSVLNKWGIEDVQALVGLASRARR